MPAPETAHPRRWTAAALALIVASGIAGVAVVAGREAPDGTVPTSTTLRSRSSEEPAVAAPAAAPAGDDITGPVTGPFSTAVDLGPTADPACEPPPGVPASAKQVVVVAAASPTSSSATVDLLVRDADVWRCELRDVAARVGRNGVRPLADRRSGDGTTPSGLFPLGSTVGPDGQSFEFFGNGADPGVPGSWRQVRAGDCWVATPNSPAYNTLVSRSAGSCRAPDEYLPAIGGAYSVAALIGANMGPDRSGDAPGEAPLAAAIFLHRFSYDAAGASRPTSGCVSLAAGDLATVVRALRPGEAWFVIG